MALSPPRPRVHCFLNAMVGPTPEILIQKATPAERFIAYSIVTEYYQAVSVVARETEEEFLREYFGAESGVWLARAGARIAGCIALRRLPAAKRFNNERVAEIKRLFVRPAWRGEGLARKLLDHAEQFAAACGYSAICLDTTDEMDAAVRLYERSGYRRCERYNDNPQATIFMRKELLRASAK